MFVSDDNKTYVKTCKNKRVTIHDKKKVKKVEIKVQCISIITVPKTNQMLLP